MTSEWVMLRTLVDLPGMNSTYQGVVKQARREKWESRKRLKGKGNEYHVSSLPKETQKALNIRAAKARAKNQIEQGIIVLPKAQADTQTLWTHFEKIPLSMQDRARFKLKVLVLFEELRDSGLTSQEAEQQIKDGYGVSRATLFRWKKVVKEIPRGDWLPCLVDDYKGGQTCAECTPEAWDFFKADYLRLERPTIADCYRRLNETAKKYDWLIPSQKTITSWTKKKIPSTTRVALREGELALLKRYPALDRSVKELHAMQWINGDGYQHNVFVLWPDGEIERPKTWFWQDVYSRKILGYRVDITENTDQIRLSIGDVIEQQGIPEDITIDNTRAAANKWMTGRVPNRYRFKIKEDDPMGLFPQLGIKVHWTSVNLGKGHGQAKPVERAFGVGGLGEWIDKHPAFAGAWTGNNPNAKPENYASKAVELDTFLAYLNGGIIEWNARQGRRTEICNGVKSFDQAFNESYQQSAIRKATDEQRRLWLLAAEAVPVAKDGTFTMGAGAKTGEGRNRYFAPELQSIGEERGKIVVRFDPQSLHDEVYCYTLRGIYVGKAGLWEAAGFGDTETARIYNKHRRQFIKAEKAAAKAERKMDDVELLARLPKPDLPASPAPGASRIVRPAQTIERPDIGNNEQIAAEAKDTLKVIQAEFAKRSDQVEIIPEDLAERYSYWHELQTRIAGGEKLSQELSDWYESYAGCADFEAGRVIVELREQSA
ncbi:hypothetical protein ACH42_09750 [Endozoicomonas sp. (ex Bugula neritina AB1)]|nr:hypothetical protein ACH42_09750 [Endozoicomonas sp. (ex Bugula neritina AB1)]